VNQSARVLLALAVGLLLGTLISASQSESLAGAVRLIEPLGSMWINAIRMTVIPLVLALIINGVAGEADRGSIGRLGARVIPIFVIILLAGGVLAITLATPLMSGLSIPADVAATLRDSAATGATTAPPPAMPSVAQRLIEIIPANPFRAAADAAMLPLVVFALLFAIALVSTDAARREPVVGFFRALGEAMMVLVQWILLVAPIGVFALALGLGMRMGVTAAGALMYYIVVLSGVLVVFILLLYPAVRLASGTPLLRFASAVAPAQSVALSSRSSLAAFSPVVAGARDVLKVPQSVTGFVLPLAVSIFRANVPVAWVVGVLFLGKLYGVDIALPELLLVVGTATLISFSVPGIPSASLFLMAPLLEQLGIPAAGAGVLIAVDAIPDMFKTTANVTSHMAVAAIAGAREGRGRGIGRGVSSLDSQ
jgi:Na+/H+-dicarboxylate symporter